MLSKKDLFNTNEYWVEELQNEIYRQVTDYMRKYDLNQNQLAEKWGVSKGYVSQILKGNCNFSLKKLVELSLALERVPVLEYISVDAYYEMEKLSNYMETQMGKSFSINTSLETTFIRHNMPSICIPNNYKNVQSVNNRPLLTVVKNELNNVA